MSNNVQKVGLTKEKKGVQLSIRLYEKDLQALKKICPKNLSYAVLQTVRFYDNSQLIDRDNDVLRREHRFKV